jgi:very-short-patch-repair endonuclease
VDLLCAEARLAIELDGAQHLAARMLIGAAAARPGFCRRTRRHLRALGRRP